MNLYSIFVLQTRSIILRVYFNICSPQKCIKCEMDTLLVVMLYFTSYLNSTIHIDRSAMVSLKRTLPDRGKKQNNNALPFVKKR